jgi:hypothetical protein
VACCGERVWSSLVKLLDKRGKRKRKGRIVFARTNGCQPSNNTSCGRVVRKTQFALGIDIKVLPAAKPPVIAANEGQTAWNVPGAQSMAWSPRADVGKITGYQSFERE